MMRTQMRTERDKMLAGELYDACDPALVTERNRVRELCQKLNASRDVEEDLRRDLCKQIFARGGDTVWMQPPFYCDYGSNIELGERVFFNFNCVVLVVDSNACFPRRTFSMMASGDLPPEEWTPGYADIASA
jgi:maltose O-acetyltransferase